jgi:two-component system, sensor histidine kinase
VYASASMMPAYFAYFYPSLLLPAIMFLRETDRLHVLTGLMMVAYVGLMTPFTQRVYRLIDESIRLRFENLGLIGKLRDQKDAAEDANVAKSRFLAAASHDLRQPLHALGLFVHALEETPLAERERHVIGNIRRSVDVMEDLFNALLDISRLDARVVQPKITTFPLASVLERVRFEYAAMAREQKLSLVVAPTSLYVHSDPSLLARIIRNLVSNALQYTQSGGVVLGCRRSGRGVRIEVWDSGIGIAADRREEIFREFHQLDNPDRDRRKGLGLGLAIVERLARLLSYPIVVRSIEGRGSVFAVTVPRGAREDYKPVDPVADVGGFDVARMLVLVVDDEVAVQEGMAALLRQWKCEVLTAGSVAEMKERLAAVSGLPDLIISDFRLRAGEDGIRMIEMLRGEFNREIPALLLTGDTAPDRLREAEASGLPILYKPLNPARLRSLISQVLQTRRAA